MRDDETNAQLHLKTDESGVTAMDYMLMPLKRYARFRGRARRKEYWLWMVLVVVAFAVLSVLDKALGIDNAIRGGASAPIGSSASYKTGLDFGNGLTGLALLAILLPMLAVQIRRLHDMNRSGWWSMLPTAFLIAGLLLAIVGTATLGLFLLGLYPLAILALMVVSCFDGTRGTNRFGPDPKNPDDDLKSVFR